MPCLRARRIDCRRPAPRAYTGAPPWSAWGQRDYGGRRAAPSLPRQAWLAAGSGPLEGRVRPSRGPEWASPVAVTASGALACAARRRILRRTRAAVWRQVGGGFLLTARSRAGPPDGGRHRGRGPGDAAAAPSAPVTGGGGARMPRFQFAFGHAPLARLPGPPPARAAPPGSRPGSRSQKRKRKSWEFRWSARHGATRNAAGLSTPRLSSSGRLLGLRVRWRQLYHQT